mmetsp:Transcript_13897/g.24945  ORF Transcript_13897/g.24945 Transcript_13897/m.24945 type:complete len:574 (+) Transcript_13897:412-2133(+)
MDLDRMPSFEHPFRMLISKNEGDDDSGDEEMEELLQCTAPDNELLRRYCNYLKIPLGYHQAFQEIAQNLLCTPLDSGWAPCLSRQHSHIYYYNFHTETTQWLHPVDKEAFTRAQNLFGENYANPEESEVIFVSESSGARTRSASLTSEEIDNEVVNSAIREENNLSSVGGNTGARARSSCSASEEINNEVVNFAIQEENNLTSVGGNTGARARSSCSASEEIDDDVLKHVIAESLKNENKKPILKKHGHSSERDAQDDDEEGNCFVDVDGGSSSPSSSCNLGKEDADGFVQVNKSKREHDSMQNRGLQEASRSKRSKHSTSEEELLVKDENSSDSSSYILVDLDTNSVKSCSTTKSLVAGIKGLHCNKLGSVISTSTDFTLVDKVSKMQVEEASGGLNCNISESGRSTTTDFTLVNRVANMQVEEASNNAKREVSDSEKDSEKVVEDGLKASHSDASFSHLQSQISMSSRGSGTQQSTESSFMSRFTTTQQNVLRYCQRNLTRASHYTDLVGMVESQLTSPHERADFFNRLLPPEDGYFYGENAADVANDRMATVFQILEDISAFPPAFFSDT